MEIRPVDQILASAGLSVPELNVLVWDEENYKVLLMQPDGQVEASPEGVRHRDGARANKQFGAFLGATQATNPDLVITPEYSMPWATLTEAIRGNIVPPRGALWVLGCESIAYADLEKLRGDLDGIATIVFEEIQPDPDRFVDPLAYVFFTTEDTTEERERLVVLVQFKTCPSADKDHFEINGMQLGSHVYQFGRRQDSLTLVSLICSDALSFEDAHAREVHDRALVIHIQLNQKPRHDEFRGCRERLFRYKGDATEVICLNWAQDVHFWHNGEETKWGNIAGSAWYLRPDGFDLRDEILRVNHTRGLYYTWLHRIRAHALFLNFEPATYLLEATKVAQVGVPAPLAHRRGPQLLARSTWDEENEDWVEQVTVEDGFAAIVHESGDAAADLRRLHDTNPILAERVLAICAGKVVQGDDWYTVTQLDSCRLGEAETILRITFSQDTDDRAVTFRTTRLRRCADLWELLSSPHNLPPALQDLSDGFNLAWDTHHPHQNAMTDAGRRATLIYMGEDSSQAQIKETTKKVAEYLRRSAADSDEGRTSRQRLAVWYREHGDLVRLPTESYTRIDSAGDFSEHDIGRPG